MKRPMMANVVLVFITFFLGSFFIEAMGIPSEAREEQADLFDILTELLERSNKEKKSNEEIQKFVSLYTKFYHRPQLITEDVLSRMYHHYESHNIMVDFIEKIPIQNPETVVKLLNRAEDIERIDRKEKALYTSIFQSLLELFSHAAKYAPHRYDYDALIGKLVDIPLNQDLFYDKIFEFFKTELKIRPGKKDLIDFVLEGIDNQTMRIENIDYRFIIKDMYKKNIIEILQNQEACSLFALLEINGLFDRLVSERENLSTANDIVNRINEFFNRLPYAEISKEAPKRIRERVMAYSNARLNKDLKKLGEKITRIVDASDLESLIEKIKTKYLLPQLKDHLVTLAYAVNAKNPKLRVFFNPNMVRLHDFDDHKRWTAWNYCGAPPADDNLSSHHFSGGLSRLNLVFAAKWHDHLFRRNLIHDSAHVQSIITNLLDFYPGPRLDQSLSYNALLIDFGLELLRKSQDNETIRTDLMTALSTITAGYHYRKAVNYLTGKSNDYGLFFTEIRQLGETFFKKRKYLEGSSCQELLEAFSQKPLSALLKEQEPRFGSVCYHTFGNLSPQQFHLFPQEVSTLFYPGWVSGEMINEFKIKVGWHLHKKKLPSILLGQVLYTYLNKTVPRFFSQNHVNDYFSTYFLFKIFNNAHLRGILKKLQREGYLKLK
jgi:hypothetical protein